MRKTIVLIAFLILSFMIDEHVARFFLSIQNPFVSSVMSWFSNLITVFFVLVVVGALFLYEENKKRYIPILLVSFFVSVAFAMAIKLVFMRPRPEGLSFIMFAFSNIILLRIPDYAFPSAHAAASFSVIPVLDKEFKKLHLFWIFFSLMIVISRIYLNMHFLSDIVAGSVLGYLTGYWTLKLEEEHGFSKKFLQHFGL